MPREAQPSQNERYITVVWCPDCTGVDPEGCFGGGVDRLGPFDTREEAERAGQEAVGDTIWEYEVENA